MQKIVVLTGAGISAESGIKTFRDSDGLWEGHDVMQVATPQGWHANQALVLDFYNQRRRQLHQVKPNKAHQALATLEKKAQVDIVTQNVDDLHEKAGSTRVLHLHGELLKARSTIDEELVYQWEKDINQGDLCEKGGQLRPHIVWFGESVPKLEEAVTIVQQADALLIIGTSMQVYPAASLSDYVSSDCKVVLVDPKPALPHGSRQNLRVITEKAVLGVPMAICELGF